MPQTTQAPGKAPRDPVLDMVRGIGIVLMVVGHSGCRADGFLYLFHMALFFMLSGVLFRPAAGLWPFVRSKLKTLWLPFVVANTAFTVCNNLFLRLNILTDDPRILELPGNITHAPTTLKDVVGRTLHWAVFDGGTQLGGALWFVQALFQVSIGYAALEFAFRRLLPRLDSRIPQGVAAAALLAVGFAAGRSGWNVWGLGIAASCYCLFYAGVLLRGLLPKAAALPKPARALAGGVAFAVLVWLRQFGSVGLAGNQYRNPAFLLAASVAGWVLVRCLASLLSGVPAVRGALVYLGRATMPVVILHFLCFKLVTAAGLCATGGEGYLLAAFPIYFTGGVWWLAYTAAGLALPLTLNALWKRGLAALGRRKGERETDAEK